MTQWGLDVLFNPAKRHMDEEKQRLQSTREEVGDASKGNRIDLESGKVTIRRKTPPTNDATDSTDTTGAVDAAESAELTASTELAASTEATPVTDAVDATESAGPTSDD